MDARWAKRIIGAAVNVGIYYYTNQGHTTGKGFLVAAGTGAVTGFTAAATAGAGWVAGMVINGSVNAAAGAVSNQINNGNPGTVGEALINAGVGAAGHGIGKLISGIGGSAAMKTEAAALSRRSMGAHLGARHASSLERQAASKAVEAAKTEAREFYGSAAASATVQFRIAQETTQPPSTHR